MFKTHLIASKPSDMIRYTIRAEFDYGIAADESPDGAWVKWEDVEAVVNLLESHRKHYDSRDTHSVLSEALGKLRRQ